MRSVEQPSGIMCVLLLADFSRLTITCAKAAQLATSLKALSGDDVGMVSLRLWRSSGMRADPCREFANLGGQHCSAGFSLPEDQIPPLWGHL